MIDLDSGTQIITIRNHKVKIELERDEDSGLPWKECDGYGVVRARYDHTEKKPGERVLSENWYYDFAASIAEAKRDGWGLGPEEQAALATKLGRAPTKKEITVEAVERDFKFLKAWCDNEWMWYGYIATLLDVDGEETEFTDSCWSYEYWLHDDSKNQHLFGEAMGAAENLVADAEKELAEIREWNERDVVTSCM